MAVPHGMPAKEFIDWVNFYTNDEAKRCRIMLAQVLLRMEELSKSYKKLESSDIYYGSSVSKLNIITKEE